MKHPCMQWFLFEVWIICGLSHFFNGFSRTLHRFISDCGRHVQRRSGLYLFSRDQSWVSRNVSAAKWLDKTSFMHHCVPVARTRKELGIFRFRGSRGGRQRRVHVIIGRRGILVVTSPRASGELPAPRAHNVVCLHHAATAAVASVNIHCLPVIYSINPTSLAKDTAAQLHNYDVDVCESWLKNTM